VDRGRRTTGVLVALRRRPQAGWAGLVTCFIGALGLPGLHVLEHVQEERALEAASPSRPVRLHRHTPDGGQVSSDDSTPDPDHGRDALSHFGVLVLARATFVVPPPALPLLPADAAPAAHDRAPSTHALSPHAPRGPPPTNARSMPLT
jgi:hypothetical protein